MIKYKIDKLNHSNYGSRFSKGYYLGQSFEALANRNKKLLNSQAYRLNHFNSGECWKPLIFEAQVEHML